MKKRGSLFILSGPAGSGKTTLVDNILQKKSLNIERVITTTTRPPRQNEINGVHYHFLSLSEFQKNIQADLFYEYAKVHEKHYYGTLKKDITDKLNANIDLLLIINVEGAQFLKKLKHEHQGLSNHLVSIFLMPKNLDTLKERMQTRNTESLEELSNRLESAKKEMDYAHIFDHIIYTTTPQADLESFISIYETQKLKVV